MVQPARSRYVEVKVIATATVEETWVLLVPADMVVDEGNALDLLGTCPAKSTTDKVYDEQDRQLISVHEVEEMSDGAAES